MHIQAKATPAASAPDLERYVRTLSEPTQPDPANPTRIPINIEGVTGRDLETGGEFVFSFDHDRIGDLLEWLDEAGYDAPTFLEGVDPTDHPGDPQNSELFVQVLTANEPGQLLNAISSATLANLSDGRIIKDVLIGQQTGTNTVYVQISFQEVKR